MAHGHEVSYPVNFPNECITSAISIFRNGRVAIVSERQTLGLDVFNIQGYGQRFIIGVPEGPHSEAAVESEATEQLRELCVCASSALGQFQSEDFGARDWKALLTWFLENILPLLLPLILDQTT